METRHNLFALTLACGYVTVNIVGDEASQTYPHVRASDRSQACRPGSPVQALQDTGLTLPGLELDEALGPDLVQDAESALATPDRVGGLDDVAGAAVAASVLDAAEGGDGDGGGAGRGGGGGDGCWFGHNFIIYCARFGCLCAISAGVPLVSRVVATRGYRPC